MDRDELWRTIHRERRALADILEDLSPAEWETASLCEGWAVRDVAAHVISSATTGVWEGTKAMVKARGSFDRMIHNEAIKAGRRPVEDIVADYRRLDGSRHHPPGTSELDPLVDILVHTQDIVIPLGRPHPMPLHAAREAAEYAYHRAMPFHAQKRLHGVTLDAVDTDWQVGKGPVVEGPVEALLLLVTGRDVARERLGGAGLALV